MSDYQNLKFKKIMQKTHFDSINFKVEKTIESIEELKAQFKQDNGLGDAVEALTKAQRWINRAKAYHLKD